MRLPEAGSAARRIRDGYRASGIVDWVDWREELWEEQRDTARQPVMAGFTDPPDTR